MAFQKRHFTGASPSWAYTSDTDTLADMHVANYYKVAAGLQPGIQVNDTIAERDSSDAEDTVRVVSIEYNHGPNTWPDVVVEVV